ncbi:ATP-dependent DNA helicase [Trichonephila clavipes]|nr:ATP-dependent DNA helicase [Trichonephila clavipes]
MGKILQTCRIIIWDECTMSHKKALEALDRTLRDFRGNRRIFGGALILLSGDFRQTLPIIPRSTPADELHACLKSSVLWRHLQKLTLKTNMRVQLQRMHRLENFAKQLMNIGNGRMEIDESTQCITLPANFCKITESIDKLVQKVFPNIAQNYKNHQWLSTRAILAAKNIDVNTINFSIQHGIPSETTTYKSIDTVENQDEVVNYPTEFLNSLDLPGMPLHVLTLKIGVPIILLRNINPPRLCNGTRLLVKKMMNNVIEATILTGKFKGEDVLLPRIPMIPTDMPFEFKRLQFPVRLAFAMTINKAQGQSLQVCGLNLENPCFSHGSSMWLAHVAAIVAAVAEWYRYRTVACFVTGSNPVPLKTRRVGQRCTLNLSRAETSSRWCGSLPLVSAKIHYQIGDGGSIADPYPCDIKKRVCLATGSLRMVAMYSVRDYCDMYLMYGRCNGNALQTAREYARPAIYPMPTSSIVWTIDCEIRKASRYWKTAERPDGSTGGCNIAPGRRDVLVQGLKPDDCQKRFYFREWLMQQQNTDNGSLHIFCGLMKHVSLVMGYSTITTAICGPWSIQPQKH